jgi:hypothetical protein
MHALVRRLGAVATTGGLMLSLVTAIAPTAHAAGNFIVVDTTTQSINTDAACSLEEAIYSANYDDNVAPDPSDLVDGGMIQTGCVPGDGDDNILLPPNATFVLNAPVEGKDNYLGPTGTPYVTSTLFLWGRGSTIVHRAGGAPFRAFAVTGVALPFFISDLYIKGFSAKGGNGANGGGGGLGAGGAIYVHHSSLMVQDTTFEGNSATGGASGADTGAGGGGGGGLGGNGGRETRSTASAFDGGGGGGGARGNGGTEVAVYPGSGGGGGTVDDGSFSTGGFHCGGNGGSTPLVGSGDGQDVPDSCPGGGGGGGGPIDGSISVFAGDGGSGSYGGGGGGGAYPNGDGGHGGFGGGGGGAGLSGSGGDGNFGGGGGAGPGGDFIGGPGSGGTFAGDGTDHYAGAGAGLGGAIFGDDADIDIANATFAGNSVLRGESDGPSATHAQDAGGAIFAVDGSLSVLNTTISGNDSTGGGAGLVMYHSTRDGYTARLRLRNSIIGGNSGHDECFVLGGVTNWNSANNMVTGHDTDVAPPCFNINLADDPLLGPLQLNAPGLTPTMALLAGSQAIGGADPTTATTHDQRGVARDALPDLGAYEFTGQPPVTTIDLSPATPDGSNGWYVSPVGVTVSATDADSSVAQTRCALDPASVPATFDDLPNAACTIGTVSTDGTHAVYAASVDTEGNVEIPVVSAGFKIDQTNPDLAPSLSSTTITLNQSGVTASPNATDATSGVASASCDPIDTSTAGVHSVECTATDNAGNTATASIDYVVAYQLQGFFAPVPGSKWLAGQTVPIKVALGDSDGARISDADAAILSAACRVTFSASGVQNRSPQCLRYDPLTQQFIYNWKLGKQPLGAVTITVTISYPGTTFTTTLSEGITITKK